MDIAAVIRDWIVAGVVLYIAVRYGFLRDQERASLNAEIGRLKGMAAPVITAEHKSMKEYAEEVTRDNQQLRQRLKELEGGRVEAKDMELKAERAYLSGKATGLFEYIEAIAILTDEAISAKDSGTVSWPEAQIELVRKIWIKQREMFDVVKNMLERRGDLR